MNINKSDNDQNLMLGVYLSIKTNSLIGRNISLFTISDLITPLRQWYCYIYPHYKCFNLTISGCDVLTSQHSLVTFNWVKLLNHLLIGSSYCTILVQHDYLWQRKVVLLSQWEGMLQRGHGINIFISWRTYVCLTVYILGVWLYKNYVNHFITHTHHQ